jgi:DNA-binding transcriptional LysR family regulator
MRRDAGSVQLTPKGESLLPAARRALAAMDEFLVASGNDSLFEGALSLGVTELVAQVHLGRFLTAFRARFPRVVVQLSVDMSVNLSRALETRALDLALQNGPFARAMSGDAPFGSCRMVWVAAPALALPDRALTIDDLRSIPLLGHARGAPQHDQFLAHLAAEGARDVRVATCNSIAVSRQMALDGLGLACLPEPMAAENIATGSLVRVGYDWTPEPLSFHARYDAETAPYYVKEAAKIAVETADGLI